jgi:hypothetical protein
MLSLYYHLMRDSGQRSLTPHRMTIIMKQMKHEFRKEKVRNGVLAHAAPGRNPCQNPSERRPGWTRFEKLVNDWKLWMKCSRKLADLIDTDEAVTIASLLSELEDAELQAYSGSKRQYASVRFARMLIHCSGCTFADTEDDWDILRSMTKHVSDTAKAFGIFHYADALVMRNAMRKRKAGLRSHKLYSLSDLVIYMCLIRNLKKEN